MTDTRYTDDLNARFDQVLAGLNVAQHEAVGNIEGPMMVVAGPGTGKTHILAARIGCILRETDTLPHNILCLTFTEAAATAMKQRLLRFIGPDAYKVHIFTFHAFCNKVIQDHRAHFPAAMAEPAGDLLRLEVLRDVLDGLPPDNPLKQDYRNPYGRESAVRSLLNVMKTEHWTTENIRQAVDEYVLGLPYRDEYLYKMSVARYGFERGDLKQNRYDQEVQRMSQVAAAADLYDAYEQTMRHAGAYDFNDMLLWVLEAFRSKEWMLRNYQEQYLYMLVDEFQDTNGAQNELIRLLADYWEAPNLFVVGDDDQAIYEFQGARLRNLLDLQTAYEANMRLVILTDNYRSTQPILDAARQVIEANGLRLVNMLPNLEKVLTAHSTVSPALPVLTTYATRTQERDAVLEHIQQLLSSGVAATDIAVIVRRHAQYSELQALLERQGIRCAAARPAEVWKHPVGQQLRVLLTYLAAETWLPFSGEAALFDLLHHRYWGIAPIDIARISLAIREDKHGVKWRSFVADTDRLVAAGVSDIETVRRTSDILEGLIQHIENIPLEAAIERVIHESGLLRHAYDLPDRIEAVQILYTFFEFVQAECIRNPRLKIANIVDTFRKMDENRLALRTNTAHLPADGVQMLTAHASKGLEFEYVFVIDVVDTEWGRDNGASKSFKLPDTLTLSNVEEDAEESRRRLFYVAMTRARKGLYLSHSRTDDKGKVLSPSGFLHQLLDSAIPLVEQVEPTPDTSKIIDSLQLRLQVSPQLSPTEPALPRAAPRRSRSG